VLVTGGSGFIGSHAIAQLLAAGHRVRATIRNLAREPEVRAMVKEAGSDPGERLSFVRADLEADAGWAESTRGCDYVLHVASPFPATVPKHEDEMIIPAREGTLRVLRAAREARVKRVVVTSSFAAIGYGHPPRATPFDESVWTNLESGVATYVKSKAVAERAAWDFIAKEGNGLELAVINPVGVFGPVLGADYSTSITMLTTLLRGALPGCPRLYFGIVDVRDVAELHLRAMSHPAAKGERFLAVSGDFLPIVEIARILKCRLGSVAGRVPTRELPNIVVRFASIFIPPLRQMVPELGKVRHASNAKARRLLGWNPRPPEEALVATAESLVRFGLLEPAKSA
jgi:dihydroflavonol-4-reductase